MASNFQSDLMDSDVRPDDLGFDPDIEFTSTAAGAEEAALEGE